ncbi:MAG: hypothetical protein FWD49_00475 [Firmicutes bacterium]|nr:hypothetical protein [Bacillota bacterium]
MTSAKNSPAQIWGDFDSTAQPLKATVHSQETRLGAHIKTYSYEAFNDGFDFISVAVKSYEVPIVNPDKILIVIPEYHKQPSEEFLIDLAKGGYFVLVPDINGTAETPTYFSEGLKYARFDLSGERINSFINSPKDSCQYQYTLIVKRAIHFAECYIKAVNRSLVGAPALLGMGDSAEIAFQTAGSGENISALLIINGLAYREYINFSRFGKEDLELTEERVNWLSSVASVAYARHISAPIFIALGTNSPVADIDRLELLKSIIPHEIFVSLSDSAGGFILNDSYETAKAWLNSVFYGESFPKSPEISLRVNSDKQIYADITLEDGAEAKSVTLYYAEGINHRLRAWHEVSGIAVSGNSYIARAHANSKNIFAYAKVVYASGECLTSIPIRLNLEDLIPENLSCAKSGVCFDVESLPCKFKELCFNEVLLAPTLAQISTQTGAKGIKAESGAVKIFKPLAGMCVNQDAFMQIDLYANETTATQIVIETEDTQGAIKSYCAWVEIYETQGFFISSRFNPQYFKDENLLPMPSWQAMASLEIRGNVSVGNILFI